jgi:sigma-E factor negative regulatory protein RseB
MTLKKKRNNLRQLNLKILTALLFSSISSFCIAQASLPDTLDLLNGMSTANRELNYDGVFIYRRGTNMEVMRLIHQRKGDDEVERLLSLTGTAREIIRNNQSVTCVFADDKSVIVEKSRANKFLTSTLPQSIESISAFYEFSIVGDGRVAGRDTWVVSIQPNDSYRYGYHLWIDKENKLLLKTELQNDNLDILEQIMFTSISVMDEMPDEMLKPSISNAGFTWYNTGELQREDSDLASIWKTGWMPEGFSMSDFEKQHANAAINELDHLVYSDGLAIVSVFIEKLKREKDAMTGATHKGAVNAYAHYQNGYQVTAVGEVPQATVQRMALSVSTIK